MYQVCRHLNNYVLVIMAKVFSSDLAKLLILIWPTILAVEAWSTVLCLCDICLVSVKWNLVKWKRINIVGEGNQNIFPNTIFSQIGLCPLSMQSNLLTQKDLNSHSLLPWICPQNIKLRRRRKINMNMLSDLKKKLKFNK